MNAARYIGRVGGLAVAFGVGTAVLGGYGAAVAKPAADGADSTVSAPRSGPAETASADSGDKASTGAKPTSGSREDTDADAVDDDAADDVDGDAADEESAVTEESADADEADTSRKPARARGAAPGRESASTDTDTDTDTATDTAEATTPSAGNTAAEPAGSTDEVAEVAPAGRTAQALTWLSSPAAVAGRKSATATQTATTAVPNPWAALIDAIFTPFAGGGPAGLPADSPLSWAAAAAARREALFAGPIVVDPATMAFEDGVIYGSINATATNGRQLFYTVIGSSPEGGKTTLLSTAGGFTFLPDLAVVNARGTDTFTVMVSQESALVVLLKQIPVLGDLVDPIVLTLQQTPILGAVLQPIIGYRVITSVTVDTGEMIPENVPFAFTTKVESFDGTKISVNFFPAAGLQNGQDAETIFNGPGLGSAGYTDPTAVISLANLIPGIKTLRDGGYNVVTWDPRGEFASGGILQLDSPFFEGRDVQALISWAATLPGVKTNAPGDPVMGMVGGSYGGGIQLVTAGIDKRVEAIVPVIAWNSLTMALYPEKAFKSGWATLLGLDLLTAGARINAQIYPAIILGDLLGFITEVQQAIIESSGPTVLVNSITAPTLLIQGTVDGLFTLRQAFTNAAMLGANGVPVDMIWACGGHGICLNPPNDNQATHLVNATMDWLDRYVRGNELVPTGPRFEWYDQNGDYHASEVMPTESGFYGEPFVTQDDGGFLPIIPIGGSGPQTQSPTPWLLSPATASKASLALNMTIAPPEGAQFVGAPQVTLTYEGLGTATHIYGQIVDDATGLVLGNLVTAIPVTLDGRSRTVTFDLEQIAYTAGAGDTLTLQLTGFATPYLDLTQIGFIDVQGVTLSLPTVSTAEPVTGELAAAVVAA
ncbi:hypothetical protein MPNTM1_03096 [Mycolicibacterium parafortuitum]|uniref:S15 peptidase family protein n=1 Tax=Mycolicibacterium parafortuitum TaxID=39692 RepID=UPI0032C495D8